VRYWIESLEKLGVKGELRFELITGSRNQPLYWLVLVTKHEIATKFWQTRHGDRQQHRMDRAHLESRDGLHKGQPGL
jgi:hypothetical protein